VNTRDIIYDPGIGLVAITTFLTGCLLMNIGMTTDA
jgi:hypothetical protein